MHLLLYMYFLTHYTSIHFIHLVYNIQFTVTHTVFRTFYSWLPLWGPILALLYLSRNAYSKQSKQFNIPRNSQIEGETAVRINSFSSNGENEGDEEASGLDVKLLADVRNHGYGYPRNLSNSFFYSEENTSPDSSLSYYINSQTRNSNSRYLTSESYRDSVGKSIVTIGTDNSGIRNSIVKKLKSNEK